MVQAASKVTQDSCPLLGTKSIGVDYGLVRTGVAVTVGYEPKPLNVLTARYNSSADEHEQAMQLYQQQTILCQEIIRLAQLEQAARIVLGLPFHKNGTIAEQTNRTLSFGQLLAQTALETLGPNVPVVWWDERYTSKEAVSRIRAKSGSDADRGSISKQNLYGTLDADAACIILEHYYHENGEGAKVIHVSDETIRRECLERYKQRIAREASQRQAVLREREEKIQRRKEAIARAQQMELLSTKENGSSAKKRRKKKR